MADKLKESAELVSALVDGQLHGEELGWVIDHLGGDIAAREAWDTYHLVGEAMRSGSSQVHAHDPLFVQRLRRRMVLDTTNLIAVDALSIRASIENEPIVQSANDPWWRRVAGLASLALVVALAYQGHLLVGEMANPTAAPQLAHLSARPANAALAANGAPPMMIRDARLDALLAAHRQFGGASALQMPSGFLRNATFDESSR